MQREDDAPFKPSAFISSPVRLQDEAQQLNGLRLHDQWQINKAVENLGCKRARGLMQTVLLFQSMVSSPLNASHPPESTPIFKTVCDGVFPKSCTATLLFLECYKTSCYPTWTFLAAVSASCLPSCPAKIWHRFFFCSSLLFTLLTSDIIAAFSIQILPPLESFPEGCGVKTLILLIPLWIFFKRSITTSRWRKYFRLSYGQHPYLFTLTCYFSQYQSTVCKLWSTIIYSSLFPTQWAVPWLVFGQLIILSST